MTREQMNKFGLRVRRAMENLGIEKPSCGIADGNPPTLCFCFCSFLFVVHDAGELLRLEFYPDFEKSQESAVTEIIPEASVAKIVTFTFAQILHGDKSEKELQEITMRALNGPRRTEPPIAPAPANCWADQAALTAALRSN